MTNSTTLVERMDVIEIKRLPCDLPKRKQDLPGSPTPNKGKEDRKGPEKENEERNGVSTALFLNSIKTRYVMKTVKAIIERASDGSFSVYCKDEIFSGMGDTLDAAKEDMLQQMDFYKETAIQKGFKYPAFLDEDFSVEYTVDIISLVKYYVEAGFLTLSGLQKLTGINQKQIWSYLNGTKPREHQKERLVAGLNKLKTDLQTILA